jgi:hypothetical protein
LGLLGWKIAMNEEKRLPFSKQFQMLGAVVDLTQAKDGLVQMSNKTTRVEELLETVKRLELGEEFSETQLQSLRGQLLYAAGNTFGRCTQIAVQALGRVARKGTRFAIDEELLRCVTFAAKTLSQAMPRKIYAWKDEWPIVIFTDGACEAEATQVTHGAVLCDLVTQSFFFFGDHVPRKFLEDWKKGGKTQVIFQAELFPIWIAKATWRGLLSHRQVIWFVDNEAARAAMVRSYSPLLDSMELIRNCAYEDVKAQSLNWYARVPSRSNLSDAASRLEFACYGPMGFTQVTPQYSHDVNEVGR